MTQTLTPADHDPDPDEVEDFVQRALEVLVCGATAQMTALGDRLGLYRGLAAHGSATPGELAHRTGCAERYLAEWLAQQAAVGFVTHDPQTGRFTLPPAHVAVLASDDSPASLAGAFQAMAAWGLGLDAAAESFRSGAGRRWDAHDARVSGGVARFFGAAYRAHLVDQWVPALGLEATLRQGARVADVGCGEGVPAVLLALAYPNSRFYGSDVSAASVERARARAREAGVSDRARFEVGEAKDLTGGPFDAIWFIDCLHDFGDPVAAAARARAQLTPQGTVAIVEPFARDELADNLATNPGAGLHYAASTLLCLPNALSQDGGAALGAQAGRRRLAEIVGSAGFEELERVAESPVHMVYAAR